MSVSGRLGKLPILAKGPTTNLPKSKTSPLWCLATVVQVGAYGMSISRKKGLRVPRSASSTETKLVSRARLPGGHSALQNPDNTVGQHAGWYGRTYFSRASLLHPKAWVRPKSVRPFLVKGYAGEPAREAIESRNYNPHVRQRGEEVQAKKRNARHKARRSVVERSLSRLNRFRKLLVHFEKKTSSREALSELACALIVFRRIIFIYG